MLPRCPLLPSSVGATMPERTLRSVSCLVIKTLQEDNLGGCSGGRRAFCGVAAPPTTGQGSSHRQSWQRVSHRGSGSPWAKSEVSAGLAPSGGPGTIVPQPSPR